MPQVPPHFSLGIFGGLLLVLAASLAMFVFVTRRSTRLRGWVVLAEWAADRGFKLGYGRRVAPLPAVLDRLHGATLLTFKSPRALLCKVQVLQANSAPASEPVSQPVSQPISQAAPERPFFHLLVQRIPADWPPAALRAVAAAPGFTDQYGLRPFHSFGTEDRFVVLASDAIAARNLWRSGAPAALPADLALLLWHDRLVIDFSARPFDPIEFDRMLALAEQLARVV
jgi:hypothetical protein